ncbi:MAG: hypothetical protein QOG15_867 [Solirubrobacteraceae bacterium]|nr:hypothetical protein [Solirubrobacteraceae bacterium]
MGSTEARWLIVSGMNEGRLTLSDRQARAVILAAEATGFEREPDLYEAWYDLDLHDDASYAAEYLAERDPEALRAAMIADEPIPADRAAERITNSGRFSYADAEVVIEVATEHGFAPGSDRPPLPSIERWQQARAAVAFMWDHHPALLSERLGEAARIAPLPPTARRPGFDW